MRQTARLGKRERKALAAYRKAALIASRRVYNDLARVADISYSMAEKWVNGYRTSQECERSFQALTGKPAFPEHVAA